MRSKQTVKDNVTALRKDDGELTRTDQETVDLLSAYFKEVYTVEDVTKLPVVTEKDFDWNNSDLNFDETTVMEKLQKLNPDKSLIQMVSTLFCLRICASVLAVSRQNRDRQNRERQNRNRQNRDVRL